MDSGISLLETFSAIVVTKMINAIRHEATESAREKERKENVCRLLASGMSVEDVSLVLKIRKENVKVIESNNAKFKIPEYSRTYKARLKKRGR